MFRTIVVPLDGSELAEQALPIAVELARRGPARLALIRIHAPPRMPMAHAHDWDDETRGREMAYLTYVSARLRERAGVQAEAALLNGHPADTICRSAHDSEAPLLVIASHGRTGLGRVLLGSVADAVIRHAQTPVLLVHAREPQDGPVPPVIHKVLVPLDGSPVAEEILPHAAAIAATVGAGVVLLRVVPPADALIEDARHDLRETAFRLGTGVPGLQVQAEACVGDAPASTIAKTAKTTGCELVAMTTRAAGLTRLVIGSVADEVIRTGPAMVLLLHPAIAA